MFIVRKERITGVNFEAINAKRVVLSTVDTMYIGFKAGKCELTDTSILDLCGFDVYKMNSYMTHLVFNYRNRGTGRVYARGEYLPLVGCEWPHVGLGGASAFGGLTLSLVVDYFRKCENYIVKKSTYREVVDRELDVKDLGLELKSWLEGDTYMCSYELHPREEIIVPSYFEGLSKSFSEADIVEARSLNPELVLRELEVGLHIGSVVGCIDCSNRGVDAYVLDERNLVLKRVWLKELDLKTRELLRKVIRRQEFKDREQEDWKFECPPEGVRVQVL